MTDNTGRGALTISAAARMVGVDRRIIRRHLEAGRFSRAKRALGTSGRGTGPWQIPVIDLCDAGLLSSEAPEYPQRMEGMDEMEGMDGTDAPASAREVSRLRAELAAALRRAQMAEVTLLECERVIEAQRLALAERTSVNGRHGPKLSSQNGRRPLNGGVNRRPTVPTPVTVTSGARPRPKPDGVGTETEDASGRSEEDARVSAALAEVAGVVNRPRSTPRFATSWASAPPWEHIPEVDQPAQRRWWQRVS
jgi:hypothetical protein